METREQRILAALQALAPTHLSVVNDSARHHGHAGDDGSGETHYSVSIGGPRFAGLSRVAAHRLVNDALAHEFSCGLHAIKIAIVAK